MTDKTVAENKATLGTRIDKLSAHFRKFSEDISGKTAKNAALKDHEERAQAKEDMNNALFVITRCFHETKIGGYSRGSDAPNYEEMACAAMTYYRSVNRLAGPMERSVGWSITGMGQRIASNILKKGGIKRDDWDALHNYVSNPLCNWGSPNRKRIMNYETPVFK